MVALSSGKQFSHSDVTAVPGLSPGEYGEPPELVTVTVMVDMPLGVLASGWNRT